MMQLLTPLPLGPRTAPNRIVFGPHVTNLANDDRSLSARHVAYYERRADGGCGTIVVEGASVHESDWPYERAPRAERCVAGWAAIVEACRPHGALVIASLDHAGGQGSSAYSQSPLWAPSRVPEVNSREVPKWMEADDIAAVVAGFAASAKLAVEADVDGVEINAGQHSLVRQFLSGLTNQRDDEWGHDRLRFARDVIEAVRAALGDDRVLGLRLSCDELAPWAGITPEMAPDIAVQLVAAGVDYLVVTRGAIFSAEKTRPDFHEPAGFNIDVCRAVHAALDIPVILQGSIVEWGQAEWALGGFEDAALCDGVEMTRAQIADPDVGRKLAADQADRIRPCTRCNQTCQVRDARNPIVTCIGEPSSGRETEDPDWYVPARQHRSVEVIGGGPAGLEVARVAAIRGHDVTIVERAEQLGGMARVAGPHLPLVEWFEREIERLGVTVRHRRRGRCQRRCRRADVVVVQATGSRAGERELRDRRRHRPRARRGRRPRWCRRAARRRERSSCSTRSAARSASPSPKTWPTARCSSPRTTSPATSWPAPATWPRPTPGSPSAACASSAGRCCARSAPTGVVLEDRYSGLQRTIDCVALVDCGFRLPTDPLPGVTIQVGDAVAPRTVHEAILEARRAALSI